MHFSSSFIFKYIPQHKYYNKNIPIKKERELRQKLEEKEQEECDITTKINTINNHTVTKKANANDDSDNDNDDDDSQKKPSFLSSPSASTSSCIISYFN